LARTLALLSLTPPPSVPQTTSSFRTTTNPTLVLYLHIPTTIAAILTTAAQTGEEWAEMANKYRYGIDANKATKEELVEFVQIVMYLHETEDLIDNDL
jgi:hypothetical protein